MFPFLSHMVRYGEGLYHSFLWIRHKWCDKFFYRNYALDMRLPNCSHFYIFFFLFLSSFAPFSISINYKAILQRVERAKKWWWIITYLLECGTCLVIIKINESTFLFLHFLFFTLNIIFIWFFYGFNIRENISFSHFSTQLLQNGFHWLNRISKV